MLVLDRVQRIWAEVDITASLERIGTCRHLGLADLGDVCLLLLVLAEHEQVPLPARLLVLKPHAAKTCQQPDLDALFSGLVPVLSGYNNRMVFWRRLVRVMPEDGVGKRSS